MPEKSCDLCGRAIKPGEPYTSLDFVTQRLNDEGVVVILEGREVTAQCVPCGYDRRDEMTGLFLGLDIVGSTAKDAA